MKQCCTCNETKPYSEFYKNKTNKDGHEYYCKPCKNIQRSKNKEVDKRYYQKNKEEKIAKAKAYENANREKVREDHRLYMKIKRKDPKFRLQQSIRALINFHLKNKTKKTNEYLGCSYEEYIVYLENQFDENMNWSNYGKDKYWEIDHIIPLSKGGSFHYLNTRPLSINENRIKGSKINIK
jgi:hypothetical protein